MSTVNERQVGGEHYRAAYQHWDFIENNGIGYLEGCATKYVARWRKKNGVQDLEKSLHYVEKLIELANAEKRAPRGHASVEDTHRFCKANELNSDETFVILMLAGWNSIYELEHGHGAILQMIAKARAETV